MKFAYGLVSLGLLVVSAAEGYGKRKRAVSVQSAPAVKFAMARPSSIRSYDAALPAASLRYENCSSALREISRPWRYPRHASCRVPARLALRD